MTARPTSTPGSIDQYLLEVARFPLLTAEGERALARRFRLERDDAAAEELVTANLRFVVKVAFEYRSYGFRIADLVQEGNIGLMRAVQKFDPDLEIRLISYAVWWIRAYIQSFILRSWSLVKVGTTQAQRRLFFSLARTRRELDRLSATYGADSDGEDDGKVALRLRVKPQEVREMAQRLERRDLSLDAPISDDGPDHHLDLLAGGAPGQDEALGSAEEGRFMADAVAEALAGLDARERYIIQHRVMTDAPLTLQDLGQHFGFSRERARQLELRAREKLRATLGELAEQVGWPVQGRLFRT